MRSKLFITLLLGLVSCTAFLLIFARKGGGGNYAPSGWECEVVRKYRTARGHRALNAEYRRCRKERGEPWQISGKYIKFNGAGDPIKQTYYKIPEGYYYAPLKTGTEKEWSDDGTLISIKQYKIYIQEDGFSTSLRIGVTKRWNTEKQLIKRVVHKPFKNEEGDYSYKVKEAECFLKDEKARIIIKSVGNETVECVGKEKADGPIDWSYQNDSEDVNSKPVPDPEPLPKPEP